MTKRRIISATLALCLLLSMVAFCFGGVSGVVTSSGIEYNESRLHTMDDYVEDAYIPSSQQWVDSSNEGDSVGVVTPPDWWPEDYKGTTEGFMSDSDPNHGNVLKFVGTSIGHFSFEDFDVKQDRKYYIYFDAKSEKANAQAVTLIGVNGPKNDSCRLFLSGKEYRNTGVQFYINGNKVEAESFKYSTEWRRYGVVLDTSNANILADIAGIYGNNFWSKSIHFQLGVQDATVYFDNLQLIEIQTMPEAVANETNVAAAVSVRFPKSAVENNGSYLSAGLRFMGSISDEAKLNADEIGFILTPSVVAAKDPAWYDISNGLKTSVKTAPCYVKGEKDVIYSRGSGYTAYQVILSGLSTESGKQSFIQRYSAAMYLKSGDTYSYYSLGETSYNEVCAKYYIMNIKSGHINTGVELVVNGKSTKTHLTGGDQLPVLSSVITDVPSSHSFLGWYDSTLTTKYTTVPGNVDMLYAMFDGYTAYTFDQGTVYDPNNRKLLTAVDDPFGGNGKVIYTPIINKNDNIDYGYYRGISPSVLDGISSKGFDFKKNHTYRVSFYYRFAESDPSNASCSVAVYATNPAGVQMNGNKTGVTERYKSGSSTLSNNGDWTLCSFEVTNTTDYAHLYIRFMGGSSTVKYNFYIDNLSIADLTLDDSSCIKLVNGGNVERTTLTVGDALPVLPDYNEQLIDRTFKFDGWYDVTMTRKYTTVDASVTTYYAKYNSYTSFSFETGGMYDPNNKYSSSSSGIAAWYRAPDPTGAGNICIRANLTSNGNNTHFALPLFEGSDQGYTFTRGKKYLILFDYYVKTTSDQSQTISVRGSAGSNIGISGGKTDTIGATSLGHLNEWASTGLMISNTDTDDIVSRPYLIILSQYTGSAELMEIYLDNIKVLVFDSNDNVEYRTPVNNVEFNDNGEVEIFKDSYIGAEMPDPVGYYGAEFIGWYNETLTVPYSCVPTNDITLYAKYNASINSFETKTVYDPNSNFGTGNSKYSFVDDPTDSSNTVLKVDLKNNDNNMHFAPIANGYSTNGYKMTIGNTYTVSFKYYAENLNSSGVKVQFRGCLSENIGISGGKSNGYGQANLKVEKQWTTQQVTFTYNGTGLADVANPYLIMLAQDGASGSGSQACTATVYFDDVVIKETVAAKTYTKKSIKVNGWTIGYQPRPHYIVVPSTNFSYLAMMQCEELKELLKNITTTSTEFAIVTEDKWTEAENQFNIFIGDVKGHSRDNAAHKVDTSNFSADNYGINFGGGNIYIDAGSTYALAMGVSECAKMIEAKADGSGLSGHNVGNYNDVINTYSSANYYRPVFLEDFNGTEINTDIWNIVNGSSIEARGYYDENGVHHSQADNNWQSIRSPEHTYLEDGKLVIEGAYSKEKELFYGGMIRSHGKMEYRYGYLEVSCITPHGDGLWTATWMTPNHAGTGLFRNEIDVNESFGNARYSAFNMHTWPTSAGSNLGKDHYSLDHHDGSGKEADAGSGKTFNDTFHTFGYFWTEDRGVFTVDGVKQFEYIFDKSSKYYNDDIDAFSESMSVIVSMTVGNPSSGKDPRLGADYWTKSNKYIIDYVHIYQIDGQEIYFTPPTE